MEHLKAGRSWLLYLGIFSALILSPGCEDDPLNNDGNNTTIEGVGPIKTMNLEFSTFGIIKLTGVGNVYYKGHPGVTSTITGVGTLFDAN